MAESLNNKTFTVKKNEEQLVKFSFTKDVIDPDRRNQILNTNLNLFVPEGNIFFDTEIVFDLNQNTGIALFENDGKGPVFISVESSHPDEVSIDITEDVKIEGITIPPKKTTVNIGIDLVETDAFLDKNNVKLFVNVKNNEIELASKEILLKSTPSADIQSSATLYDDAITKRIGSDIPLFTAPLSLNDNTSIVVSSNNIEFDNDNNPIQRINLLFNNIATHPNSPIDSQVLISIPNESQRIISFGFINSTTTQRTLNLPGGLENIPISVTIFRKVTNDNKNLIPAQSANFTIQVLSNSRELQETEYTITFINS